MIPTLATALTIAASLWGPAPCGTLGVRYDNPNPDWIGYSQPNYADLTTSPCVIHLAPWLRTQDAVLRCHVIVHEWGHLTGHDHSPDPRNVMYPTPQNLYWKCRKASRKGA